MGKGQYIKIDESYLFVGMNKNYAYELKDEAKEFWDKVKELNKKSIDIFKVLYKQLLTNKFDNYNIEWCLLTVNQINILNGLYEVGSNKIYIDNLMYIIL